MWLNSEANLVRQASPGELVRIAGLREGRDGAETEEKRKRNGSSLEGLRARLTRQRVPSLYIYIRGGTGNGERDS